MPIYLLLLLAAFLLLLPLGFELIPFYDVPKTKNDLTIIDVWSWSEHVHVANYRCELRAWYESQSGPVKDQHD